jgi:hypothetical protein
VTETVAAVGPCAVGPTLAPGDAHDKSTHVSDASAARILTVCEYGRASPPLRIVAMNTLRPESVSVGRAPNKVVPSAANRRHAARSHRHLARSRAARVRKTGGEERPEADSVERSAGFALQPPAKHGLEIRWLLREPREVDRQICQPELTIESNHAQKSWGQPRRVFRGIAQVEA